MQPIGFIPVRIRTFHQLEPLHFISLLFFFPGHFLFSSAELSLPTDWC